MLKGEIVFDPYNYKARFESWIKRVDEQGIDGLSKINSDLIIRFIKDFSIGINTSMTSKKGERSKTRLIKLQQKIVFVIRKLEERSIEDIREAKAQDLHSLFSDMRNGILKTKLGNSYKSTGDYVKDIKCFWHWYQKVSKREGKIVEDITEELDRRGEKPVFVYLDEHEYETIIEHASFDLKPILALVYDAGMRVTEMMNIKVSDFSNDFKKLNIRDETSKTFGRKINLMLCSGHIKSYVNKLHLGNDDFICRKSAVMVNRELRELGKLYLKPEKTKLKNLSLYDFRHSSACYWLPRYKSQNAMMYRFGWKKPDMIHYYTEFLGMKDTINDDDMYVDITKTELERRLKDVTERQQKYDEILQQLIFNLEGKQGQAWMQAGSSAIAELLPMFKKKEK